MRVGVIGCGAIAKRAHLPAFTSLKEIELYGVVDINETVARRIAKKFRARKYFTDYRDLLRDPSVELVSICTPTPLHAQMVVDSVNAGKHVLVEKPLALTVKDALCVLRAVKENGVRVCVVRNFRYVPAMQNVKNLIEEGKLGRLVSILGCAHTQIPLYWTSSTWLYEKWGALDDFAPHLIDAICWLNTAKVKRVVAFGGDFLESMGCLNYLQILMQFENKTVAVASVTWLTPFSLFLNIHGTAGSVHVDVRFNHYLRYHDFLDPVEEFKSVSKKLVDSTKQAFTGKLFRGSLGFYKQLITDFLMSIRKGGQVPSTVEDAMQVVAISEATKKSLEQKEVVDIDDFVKDSL